MAEHRVPEFTAEPWANCCAQAWPSSQSNFQGAKSVNLFPWKIEPSQNVGQI